MADDLETFYQDFFQEILASADVDARFAEDAFFDLICDYLIAAGELETADRAPYCPPRGGLRVDGYGGDPIDSGGTLSLIVADFSQTPAIETLTATDMAAIFKRTENFLQKCLDERFRNSLEETDPAFGLADLIASRWPQIVRVRMFLITNRILSSRVDGREAGSVRQVPVTYSVWDVGRIHRFASAGQREEIRVDLENEFGGALPVLRAHLNDAGYQAFLAVVPGLQLAAIYDRWGARLLEQNVRVFLQARGTVNKRIRTTLENDPEMFFAYNNGLTATAEGLETRQTPQGLVVCSLRNLQIVNGGQTTASIHAASRKKGPDLSRVFVQMKLSIIEPARAMEVVPRISEFANSQNRINAADFFANHPFHVRLEAFSRRMYAPSPDGSFRESKWFYERARGQYQDARALLTPVQRKKFDIEYPKSQLVEKTDLAKVINSWRGLPEVVSRGSQKNFGDFARSIGAEWAADPDAFNEAFYRQAIAQVIVFRGTERLVSEQPWYQGGGIRSRVVPYAIAKLAYDAAARERFVDLEAVWRSQTLSPELTKALVVASKAVNEVIMGVAAAIPNPLEWAKQQACWNKVKGLNIVWPPWWYNSLLTRDQLKGAKRSAVKEQRVLNGIEAQTAVIKAGAEFWKTAKAWGDANHVLSATESSIFAVATVPGRLPSEKQSIRMIEALRKLHLEGFAEGHDLLL